MSLGPRSMVLESWVLFRSREGHSKSPFGTESSYTCSSDRGPSRPKGPRKDRRKTCLRPWRDFSLTGAEDIDKEAAVGDQHELLTGSSRRTIPAVGFDLKDSTMSC